MLIPAIVFLASQPSAIEVRLRQIEQVSGASLGAAVITPREEHYLRPAELFSLQSVMKLMVAMAALEQVDRGRWQLNQKFTFRRSDLSVSHQPIIEVLGNRTQVTVTLDQCIDLMVTNSCSGAADFIIRKLGGPHKVNKFLERHEIWGMRVDRQERDLQTQVAGVTWRPEFIDSAKMEAAIERLPAEARDRAYQRYRKDPRDTTTPAAMGKLLRKLVTGKLLHPASTKYLLGVMERTVTGPDRLSAGIPAGWRFGHKTGTSSTHDGLNHATNDVGIARRPNGDWVIIVGLLKDSRVDAEARAEALRLVATVAMMDR